ncbi:MAG: response regulator [Luteolibacter sp.]
MNTPTIGLVDDDPGVLLSLERLLRGRGYRVRAFTSAEDFLTGYREAGLDCVVLDLAMPGQGGLEVQAELTRSCAALPVLFLSGEGDIPSTVKAVKGGAVNFLTKPADAGDLLNALRLALIESSRHQTEEKEFAELRKRFEKLSSREREILCHVIAGKLNKQIAVDLGISEQTVKIHRMRITEKTGLPSVAELVRATVHLDIRPAV